MTSSSDDHSELPPAQPRNVIRLDTLARAGRPDDAVPPEDLASRVRQLGRISGEAQWAYVRDKLEPMLLQRMKRVNMAEIFNVSVDTIYRWCARLQDEMRKEAVSIQPRDFIMESLTSLRVARGEAWATYYSLTNPKEKARWLTHVLRVEDQWRHLGAAVGMFGGQDDRPLSPKTYGEGREERGGGNFLQKLAKQFLSNPYRTGTRETDLELDGTTPEAPPEPVLSAPAELSYEELFAEMGEYDGDGLPDPEPPVPPAPQSPPNITVRRRAQPHA